MDTVDNEAYARINPKEQGEFSEQFDVSAKGLVNVADRVLVSAKKREGVRGNDLLTCNTTTEEEAEWLSNAPYEVEAYSSYPGNLYISFSLIPDSDHPHANLQIARIKFDVNSGQVTSIHRDVSPGVFTTAIFDFPPSTLLGQIREVLKLPVPTDRDKAEYARLTQSQTEFSINELLKLSNPDICSGELIEDQSNTHQIHSIFSGEYSALQNGSTRYLATFEAFDCLIISIYNSTQQKGALAHIGNSTDEVLTAQIMANNVGINRLNRPKYEITILGGASASAHHLVNLYLEIQNWKKRNPNIQVSIGPVLTGRRRSLALDLSSGEVKRFIPDRLLHPEWSSIPQQITRRVWEANAKGRQAAQPSFPKQN